MVFHRYKNLAGTSGVTAYELGDDYIKVEFEGEAVYLYTSEVTGKEKLETMKKLAKQGRGLSTYISQHVEDAYAARLQ